MTPQENDRFIFLRFIVLILSLAIIVAGMGLAMVLIIGMLKATYYDIGLIVENLLLWVNK